MVLQKKAGDFFVKQPHIGTKQMKSASSYEFGKSGPGFYVKELD